MLWIWLNMFSLSFISCTFFDFNPKMVFVEIQEEQNEDGMEEDTVEIEFMKSVHWHDAGFTLTHAL
ncbi:MAG TPA: hypothetical protein VD905_00750, partial [Flavobacteriales bacterium]|nr:hypothetical protein [Flavobacteriales bacterium]